MARLPINVLTPSDAGSPHEVLMEVDMSVHVIWVIAPSAFPVQGRGLAARYMPTLTIRLLVSLTLAFSMHPVLNCLILCPSQTP